MKHERIKLGTDGFIAQARAGRIIAKSYRDQDKQETFILELAGVTVNISGQYFRALVEKLDLKQFGEKDLGTAKALYYI